MSEGRDPLAEKEAERAAQEAAQIGGKGGDYPGDEADRPVQEGGEGESEGFELAEEALEGQATHADSPINPKYETFAPESDEPGSEHGEADEPVDREAVEGNAGKAES